MVQSKWDLKHVQFLFFCFSGLSLFLWLGQKHRSQIPSVFPQARQWNLIMKLNMPRKGTKQFYIRPSVHPSSSRWPLPLHVGGLAQWRCSVRRSHPGHVTSLLQGHAETQTTICTHTSRQFLVASCLMRMCLDWGRKPDHQDRSHADTRRVRTAGGGRSNITINIDDILIIWGYFFGLRSCMTNVKIGGFCL